ncbi:GyrI-like domain-containing protein [Mesonia sp. K7]|uniref:GyrI-like domain-containing protein n=1 Tax=Mesonia sp. K7 TaxID=2218606 RepID=UPI000DAA4519|nr:GyrI-like domain-containing protein [Mesonia sp. K7]PZD79631.1 AraC family transcriptional regulator [Mesonia sp. K7]
MKLFKYLFFLLLIVIIGGAIYVATLDNDFRVEKSKKMAVPNVLAFEEVNNYKNWENWDPRIANDQNISFALSEKTIGEGATYSWESSTYNDGKYETTEVIPNNSIKQKYSFDTTFGKAEKEMNWVFTTENDSTKVIWTIEGKRNFWEKLAMLIDDQSSEEKFAPMLENGLDNIEKSILKKMETFSINVDGVTRHSGGFYLYSSTSSRSDSKMLGEKMAEILPTIHRFMVDNNIPINGAPLTVYNEINEMNNSVIISPGIPTNSRIITPTDSNILCGFLPAQPVLKTTLKGDYKNLSAAWTTAEEYLNQNNLMKDMSADPFEVYVTDPATNPNPAAWVTEIYIPILEEKPTTTKDPVSAQENSPLEETQM